MRRDLPSLNSLGAVAVEGEIVEDSALWTTRQRWVLSLQAYIEGAAVIGLHVACVVQFMTITLDLGSVRAAESIFEHLCR